MGIDYKKKYLKYKNKYLEAKKIYGGADELKNKIDELKKTIEELRKSGISNMIDDLLTKCSECENTQQVAELEKEVEELKKQLAEAEEGKQNVDERKGVEGELQQMPADPNNEGKPEVMSEDKEESEGLGLLEKMRGNILNTAREKGKLIEEQRKEAVAAPEDVEEGN